MTATTARHPYHLHLLAYGVALHLRSDDRDLLAHAAAHLPFGARILSEAAPAPEPHLFTLLGATAGAAFRLRRNNRTIVSLQDLPTFLDHLHAHLMTTVAEHAPDHLFLHAGVVAWQGKAILLPGRSFAGKTTLTAALVRAGATYYSDEYALLDAGGLIHPHARDLQMRSPGHAEQRALPVAALGGVPGDCAIPAAVILFVEYKSGAVWSPQPLTPAMAVLELIRHAAAVRRIPARTMQMLARLTQSTPAFRSLRGEADPTATLILDWLSNAHGESPEKMEATAR